MSLVSGRKGGVEESLIGGGAVAVVAAIQAAVAAAGVAVGERERERVVARGTRILLGGRRWAGIGRC